MREFMTVDVLANTVSMLASSREGAIWISDCEEDARFYETRCAHPKAVVISVPGGAAEVLRVLRGRGLEGVVATLSDGSVPMSDHEFALDAGDATTLLAFSSCGTLVLRDVAGQEWIEAAERKCGQIRERILRLAGALRLAQEALEIDSIDSAGATKLAETLICWRAFDLKRDWASDLQRSGEDPNRVTEVSRRFEALPEGAQLARSCGREGLTVFLLALQNFAPRGVRPRSKVARDELLGMLRIGFEMREFELDSMFWKMRTWQRAWKYPLLAEWRELDPLGVLWDQRYWEDDLRLLLSTNSGQSFAAFKLDLDGFGEVNRAVGHSLGDEAIRFYCQIVKEQLGHVAEVYRRGGDEVVAFAPCLEEQDARWLAERVRLSVADKFTSWCTQQNLQTSLTASVGLVICDAATPQTKLVAALDQAQLAAKNHGKNRVEASRI